MFVKLAKRFLSFGLFTKFYSDVQVLDEQFRNAEKEATHWKEQCARGETQLQTFREERDAIVAQLQQIMKVKEASAEAARAELQEREVEVKRLQSDVERQSAQIQQLQSDEKSRGTGRARVKAHRTQDAHDIAADHTKEVRYSFFLLRKDATIF